MINFQWEKCEVCKCDKKYVQFNGDKEILVCKYGHKKSEKCLHDALLSEPAVYGIVCTCSKCVVKG